MEKIKPKEIVDTYRKLLDPMGYTIIPKTILKEEQEAWKPDDIDEYKKLDSMEISKKLQELKTQADGLKKIVEQARKDAIKFMNGQPPNEITAKLYKETFNKSTEIDARVIKVSSSRLNQTNKLINFLEDFKKIKLRDELQEKLQREYNDVEQIKIEQKIGGPELEITIK